MDLFDISEIVRKTRRERGLTQQQLADAAGISRVRLNRLESGVVFEMNFGSVLTILNALELDLRVTDFNAGRPVFEDIQRENEADFEP